MRTSIGILLPAIVLLAGAPLGAADPEVRNYPETKRVDHIDTYHGKQVADPYRWLEQDVREAPEVAAWVAAQNKLTAAYLDSIAERETIRRRLTELWNFEKFDGGEKAGSRYFFSKNDGLQNQAVVYKLDSLDGKPEVLIDPNQWSQDGTVALSSYIFSDDGRYVAYSVADAGSDWRIWRVMEVETGKALGDELKWTKFTTAAWTKDNKGFFYGRFDEPKEGAAFQSLNLNQKLYYHRVGTAQSEDVLVYQRADNPEWVFWGEVSSDGRYLVITIAQGSADKYRIAYKDLSEPYGMPLDLITNFDNEYTFVGSDGSRLFFQTDVDAPRKRLIAIDVTRPERENWAEIIAESEDTLVRANFVGNLFLATYLKDARTLVKVHAMDGKFIREVEFGTLATATGFFGKRGDTETFYSLTGFALPPTLYHYDIITGESTEFRKPKVAFDSNDYVTTQIFYNSKDGTRVPMFISHKKGVTPNGENPALLYGYGGFNISTPPRFSTAWLAWMEMGGVLAAANLRGGGEYGEEWHQAGTKLNKQNVFDDFIAAAEWLIANKYTRKEKLAINGRSNGGLLVGAVMTQRPDLFGACLADVGVMDMLRFHKFTAGRFWTGDYGSSDNAEEFEALLAYSPYHNLKEGVEYPPTLVTTADTDDRVVPGHSFKFAARLQHAQAGDAPALARIETRAGHGAGTPTVKLIEEATDKWAFLWKTLGMKKAE
ncbi:MAG: prolyl oligopeptidase family serine peptidase [Bryobacterales bacterium]